jgi:hypothetical protein
MYITIMSITIMSITIMYITIMYITIMYIITVVTINIMYIAIMHISMDIVDVFMLDAILTGIPRVPLTIVTVHTPTFGLMHIIPIGIPIPIGIGIGVTMVGTGLGCPIILIIGPEHIIQTFHFPNIANVILINKLFQTFQNISKCISFLVFK